MSNTDERRQRADSIFRAMRESRHHGDGERPDDEDAPVEHPVSEASESAEALTAADEGQPEEEVVDVAHQHHVAQPVTHAHGTARESGGITVQGPGGNKSQEPASGADPGEPGLQRLKVSASQFSNPRMLGDYSTARPDVPRVMAIANQKGGVGKTTTAVNLGAALAVLGYRVLIVDLDPQGNATTGLGVNARNLESSVYDVMLHDVAIEDCIEPTNLRNLFVVPATIDLAGAEIELVPTFSRELRLKRAIDSVIEDFDYVLIDCPPSLGLLTVNALAAAGEVAVPIQCEYYALEGLGQLLNNIERVRANLNPRLIVSTIILTMYDARTRLAEQVVDEVRAHFGPRVCRTVVPRTVRLSEAPSFGQPIIVFDPSSRGATAYRELAKEVSGGPPQRVG
jgi:chromosome partitioning protein